MPRTLLQIFAIPAALAVASLVGLVSALVGDGVWDVLSWAALGLVIVVVTWRGLPWQRIKSHRRAP